MSDASHPEMSSGQGAQGGPADELEQRLLDARPVPSAGFRGGLGRMLAAGDPGFGPRPARLRLIVAGWLGVGLIVAGVGAVEALASL